MAWVWIPTERAFVDTALSGCAIAIGFSFIILVIATGNLLLPLLAITCLSIVIVSVLAIMVLKGWEMGTAESVSVVILIGLSVDYVIHLSSDYAHSRHASRHERIREAYGQMGVSILSGAITTLGSGLALFGGRMRIMQKFAVIITSTITISFVSSMVLFGALCHVVGP